MLAIPKNNYPLKKFIIVILWKIKLTCNILQNPLPRNGQARYTGNAIKTVVQNKLQAQGFLMLISNVAGRFI